MENINSLNVIKSALTAEQYRGYLLGNALQYQCSINSEDASENDKLKDIEKAADYILWLKDDLMQSGVTIGQKLHNNNIQEIQKDTQDFGRETKVAFTILKETMHTDKGLAWYWYCKFAHAMIDEGVDRIIANKSAVRIMKGLFDIDTTQFEVYKLTMKNNSAKDEPIMDFGSAFEALKNGKKIARKSWGDIKHTDYNTIIKYISKDENGSIVQDSNNRYWCATAHDILAEDWIIVED